MPPLRATWHALTQVLVVGLGASVGREVAPREMAAAFSAAAADRLGLTPEDRRIIVACGAGAGLAAVYSIPLSGAVYTLEILLVSLSARAVAPALITSGIAVLISTGFTRPTFFYTVPTLTPSLSLTVFGALMGPVLGAAGWAFKQAVARTGAIRPRDWRDPRHPAPRVRRRRPGVHPHSLRARQRAGQRADPVRRRLGDRCWPGPRRAGTRRQDGHDLPHDPRRRLGRRPNPRRRPRRWHRGRHRPALGSRVARLAGRRLRLHRGRRVPRARP